MQQHLDVLDGRDAVPRAVHSEARLLVRARPRPERQDRQGEAHDDRREDQEAGGLERRRPGHLPGLQVRLATGDQPEERRRKPQRLRLDQDDHAHEQGRQELQRHLREAVRSLEGPLNGQPDFNNVWLNDTNNPKTGKPISDGPFTMTNYTKGQSMTFTANPKWWGPHKPYLSKVVFVFRTNTDTEIQAIRGGEVDAIYPQPQLQLVDLKGQPGLKIESNAGTTLEHLDFNEQLKGGMPLLRAPWFRQALAYAVNRQAVITQIYKKFNPKQQVLQNLTYGNSQKGLYVPHFQKYVFSPTKVASIMTKHNCTKGSDGIWSCNGTKATIKYGTTTGNKLRELVQEIVQAQAKSAGIQFVTDNDPSRLFFPRVSDGNYQIAMFAWVGTGDPFGQTDIYGIGGGSNWKGYNSVKVTNLFKASDAELNPTKRTALVNAADANMAANVPTLPVVQKPTFLVYKTKIHGIRDNSTVQGPTDNMQDWWVG
ncbi:MAG: hypothetical protein E6G20_09260 [Actinobacteria bacterium]|nr:MAG: hypothetical protein E6G20_09260 [Actinomycetota bacterium]